MYTVEHVNQIYLQHVCRAYSKIGLCECLIFHITMSSTHLLISGCRSYFTCSTLEFGYIREQDANTTAVRGLYTVCIFWGVAMHVCTYQHSCIFRLAPGMESYGVLFVSKLLMLLGKQVIISLSDKIKIMTSCSNI